MSPDTRCFPSLVALIKGRIEPLVSDDIVTGAPGLYLEAFTDNAKWVRCSRRERYLDTVAASKTSETLTSNQQRLGDYYRVI